MVKLAIRMDGETLRVIDVCWQYRTEKLIVPNREPDHFEKGAWKWIIKLEDRKAFLDNANKVLEKSDSYSEEVHGFFGLAGVGLQWAYDGRTEWWLIRTRKDVSECQFPKS